MSNRIGSEGMGLFSLILSVYFAAAVISTSGISMAVVRLVSEEKGKGLEKNAELVLKKACALSLFLSLAAASSLYFFAEPIGNGLLGDARTVSALKILAPSLPFMGFSSCVRGYFHGVKNAVKPSSSLILEQLLRMALTAVFLGLYAPGNLSDACFAVSLASVISEAGACVYLFILYRTEKRKKVRGAAAKLKGVLRKISVICFPLAASSYVRSVLNTAENIMIPPGLEKYGASPKASLEQYGMLKGMAMPLLTFPSVFLSSVSTLLVPEISEANVLGQKGRIQYTVDRVIWLTSILSILIAGLFILFSGELGKLIYNSGGVGTLLGWLAPLVPLMYLDFVVDGMLIGLNQQVSSLKYNILDSVLRVGLLYVLIPKLGVGGLILVMFICKVINMTLSIGRLLKVTDMKMKLMDWILKPIFSVCLAGFAASLLYRWLIPEGASRGLVLALEMLPVTVVYFLILVVLRCIKGEDIRWFRSIFKRNGTKTQIQA
jgi:stage V sporulation protein B